MISLTALLAGSTIAALLHRRTADEVDQAFSDLVAYYAKAKDWDAVKWLRAHEDETRTGLWRHLKDPKGSLFARFSERAMPKKGQKGHRALEPSTDDKDLHQLAQVMLSLTRAYWEEPEIFSLFMSTKAMLGVSMIDDPPVDASWEDVTEFADELSVPRSLHGLTLTPAERGDIALFVIELVSLTRDWISTSGKATRPGEFSPPGPYTPRYPDPDDLLETLPLWVAEAILSDALANPAKLHMVPVTRQDADAFIRYHHSVLGKPGVKEGGVPYRTMYLLGARYGDRLVAVASAGHPSGRWANQKNVLELTRIASDSTVPNASSMLASRLLDLAPYSKRDDPSDPWHFVTYSLVSESGTTYEALRDKGLKPVAVNPGRAAGGGGRRKQAQAAVQHAKVVWEAGPASRPARWFLLEAVRNQAPVKQLVKASREENEAKAQALLEPWLKP